MVILTLRNGGEGRMNRELVNNMVGRLPIAMAGIVHGFDRNGISLSNFAHTVSPLTKRPLP